MYEKLKSFLANDTYFIAILIILVGFSSYGLGRFSVLESAPTTQSGNTLQALTPLNQSKSTSNNISVVASRSGSKYHLPDCPGAGQIKTENRIEFSTIDGAEAAGYTPAANCPGLKK